MAVSIILLIVGIALLVKGADFFVDGAGGIARKLRIPAVIIGLTVVSVGTSLPELSVSVTSALKQMDDMSFGNVIGSNTFNVLMVVGLSALFVPMTVHRSMLKFDIPILLGIYALLLVFAYLISPGVLSRGESIALAALFVAYTVFLIVRSKKDPDVGEEDEQKDMPWWMDLLYLAVGAAGIIFGGNATVDAASNIAVRLGMSEMLVALTIVAIGTSLPELVTSLVAAKKGQMDIAIGNAIGSCIANLLLILGVSSSVYPISTMDTGLDMIVMIVSAVLVWVFCMVGNKKITRGKGVVMVAIYLLYFVYIILRNQYPALVLHF